MSPTETKSSERVLPWLFFVLATLLVHVFLFAWRPAWNVSSTPSRVVVQQIDPKKLDAIRKQWARTRKDSQNQQLLIDKDKNRPSDREAPKDARYMSDKNIRVEKEQRARQTNVVPKAGGRADTIAQKPLPAQPKPKPVAKAPPKSLLGRLGVPLNLGKPAPRKPEPEKQNAAQVASRNQEAGGDQALNDPNLPEGSENLLNAQESVYYSFYARIFESIGPVWQSNVRGNPPRRKLSPGDYTTYVDIVFDSDGNLVEVKHLKNSGVNEFDRAVDDSWKRVSKFPNPPKGLLNESGQVHIAWNFTVEVGEGFNIDYLPPERVE